MYDMMPRPWWVWLTCLSHRSNIDWTAATAAQQIYSRECWPQRREACVGRDLIPTIVHSPLYWESRDGCQWSSFLAELVTCTHTTPPQDLHILIQSHTAMQIERWAVQFDDHCPVSPQNHYNNLPCAVQVTLCCVNSECVLQ